MMRNISFNHYICNLHNFLEKALITDNNSKVLDIHMGISYIINSLCKMNRDLNKIMIIGNGGSAAIASHLQNDLCKGSLTRAMVFTEQPLLTALSNDINYSAVYQELVTLWADKSDILFAISSSGRSQNIIDAVSAARKKGCFVITLSGFLSDNPLRKMGDINYYIPSEEYGYVELAHSVFAHYLSDQLKLEVNRNP